jgi:hypothetical protein
VEKLEADAELAPAILQARKDGLKYAPKTGTAGVGILSVTPLPYVLHLKKTVEEGEQDDSTD